MYENQAKLAAYQGDICGSGALIDRQSPTLSQNIDHRIERMKADVTRLEQVKALLATPGGILNVPIDDLRFAMSY